MFHEYSIASCLVSKSASTQNKISEGDHNIHSGKIRSNVLIVFLAFILGQFVVAPFPVAPFPVWYLQKLDTQKLSRYDFLRILAFIWQENFQQLHFCLSDHCLQRTCQLVTHKTQKKIYTYCKMLVLNSFPNFLMHTNSWPQAVSFLFYRIIE